MESISDVRQMMAESKFFDALKSVEMHLSMANESQRKDFLPIYLELLELQDKKISVDLILEVAEICFEHETDLAIKWIEKLPENVPAQYFRRLQVLKIRFAEKKGRLDQLYGHISELKLRMFESKVPAKIDLIEALVSRYFKNDFHLKLQDLALALMLGDIPTAEIQVRELIISCVEKVASSKGTREKLLAIAEIINTAREKNQLEIYQSFCFIYANGISTKSQYKKIVEMIIYFDDFQLQIILLDLMEKLGLSEAVSSVSLNIKSNIKYDYVYIEKYFSNLKRYFTRQVNRTTKSDPEVEVPDLKIDKPLSTLAKNEIELESASEEETLIISLLKFQDHTCEQLIELATSFLQSNLIRAAAYASELAMNKASSNHAFLKAAYLRGTCLLQSGDFRAALDLALDSLSKAEVQDDILSFLYLQAEAYIRLKLKLEAKQALKKIMSIDSEYRLTKERLERLDEI